MAKNPDFKRKNKRAIHRSMHQLYKFIAQKRRTSRRPLFAASLFSGGGISDCGYELAGFNIVAQAEMDPHRVMLCKNNFPKSAVIEGDLKVTASRFITTVHRRRRKPLDLLSITPPCQGMSSANPSRGKRSDGTTRDHRNDLVLQAIPIINELSPRSFVIENVPSFLSEAIQYEGQNYRIAELLEKFLRGKYKIFSGIIRFADYGVPQLRKRAIIVGIRLDQPSVNELVLRGLAPWPKRTHHDAGESDSIPWVTAGQWFKFRDYPPLDAARLDNSKDPNDPLHNVPSYDDKPDRYRWISDIPAYSGKNAYQNSTCPTCGVQDVPTEMAYCHVCNAIMLNRPYVIEKNGDARLIYGFQSSYRRMSPNLPSATITTNSSHLGSDFKIHPWENRVLSIRECAELQTVPAYYDWSWAIETKHTYITRVVIGEALPSWFTFLLGKTIKQLLDGDIAYSDLAELTM